MLNVTFVYVICSHYLLIFTVRRDILKVFNSVVICKIFLKLHQNILLKKFKHQVLIFFSISRLFKRMFFPLVFCVPFDGMLNISQAIVVVFECSEETYMSNFLIFTVPMDMVAGKLINLIISMECDDVIKKFTWPRLIRVILMSKKPRLVRVNDT